MGHGCEQYATTEQGAVATWPLRNTQALVEWQAGAAIGHAWQQYATTEQGAVATWPFRNTQALVEWYRNGQVATAPCSVVECCCSGANSARPRFQSSIPSPLCRLHSILRSHWLRDARPYQHNTFSQGALLRSVLEVEEQLQVTTIGRPFHI